MKVLLRIFVFLLIVGVILIGVGIAGGMDTSRISSTFNQNEAYGEPIHYTESEQIDKLVIDVAVKHVDVSYTESDSLKLTYYSHTDDIWEVKRDLDVLTISQTQKVKFVIFGFNFGFVDRELLTLKVEIPQHWVLDYDLTTNTGDIKMIGKFLDPIFMSRLLAKTISIESDTGDVEVTYLSTPSLELKTDTGDIAILNMLVIENIKATNSTGVIHFEDSYAQEVDIFGSTGRIEIENLHVLSLNIDSDTGQVIIKDTEVDSLIRVRLSTGRIGLFDVSAATYDLKTNTGDVEVELISLLDTRFDLSTNTGKIMVDGINQGDRHVTTTGSISINAETETGNIYILVRD